jgi:aminomethyltransferase
MKLEGRAIARHGYPVLDADTDAQLGVVTSGAPSPTLGMPIAMAYVPPQDAAVGTMVDVAIRTARADAEIVSLPFYKRAP